MRHRSNWGGIIASACIGIGLLAAPLVGSTASAASTRAPAASHRLKVVTHAAPIKRVGTVNLEKAWVASRQREKMSGHAASSNSNVGDYGHRTSLGVPHRRGALARPEATGSAARTTFAGNIKGEHGFNGISAAINGAANSPDTGGVGDVSPPDQGLAVGPSPAGTVLVELVNDTLNIYSPRGTTLLGAIPAYQLFGLPSTAFLSDPRVMWDPQTRHWFATMFTVGDGVSAPLSTQYIAVSQTQDPFGAFTIFSIDTSDSSNTAGGCPCFGDYDMIGADHYGFYITTNQFSVDNGNFNGTVMYAISKSQLISSADSFGVPPPVVQTYMVPFASDPFAAYHLSPSTVTQGSREPTTEYFVESNSNLNYGKGLEVFALIHTDLLQLGIAPPLVEQTVASESYAFPPNALQKSGPTPYGASVGFDGTASLETDFNAVQEVTFADGNLYAELDTGFNYRTTQLSGAAYFVMRVAQRNAAISVRMVRQGYVETSQNLLYPVIGVNHLGVGFMAFAVSGPNRYPSAAYTTFSGAAGAGKVVHIAARGVNPLDDFTCYPPFSTGQCRYGDYSMAQAYNGQIYMATEYVAPVPRDPLSNWSTRIYWAPTSAG